MNQPGSGGDPGLTAVDLLYELLMVDDEWALRRERGFTWWAYRLAQHVEASEPFEGPDGAIACNIRIWTDIVADVPDRDAKGPAALAMVNQSETMSAIVWNNESRTVSECCSSIVCADTVKTWVKVLTTAAVLQNCAAHSRANALAEVLGGQVAASEHPKNGERPEMDDTLNIPAQMALDGASNSKYVGKLMERLTSSGSPLSAFSSMTNGDAEGLTAEFPYSGPRPAAVLAGTEEPVETALLQVFTNQPHPQLGNGALIVLKLPQTIPEEDKDGAIAYANALNFLEGTTDTGVSLLGAWCVDPQSADSLAFVTFVPQVLAMGGVLENLCSYNAIRVRWAYGVLND
jgi:hypothetical protein